MAFHYSPKIVTDGLVLYLDAANTKSYPGSGTTWNDLSKSQLNGTLTNGPTFNSANGGSIVFDGVDDYVDLGNVLNPGLSSQTISLWCKVGSQISPGAGILVSKGNQVSTTIGHTIFVNTIDNVLQVRVNANNTTTQRAWQTLTFNNLTSYFNVVMVIDRISNVVLGYYNGSNDGWVSGPLTNSISGFNSITTTTPLFLGKSITYDLNGNISNFMVYNRALSSSEILQNYNTTKSRFGL